MLIGLLLGSLIPRRLSSLIPSCLSRRPALCGLILCGLLSCLSRRLALCGLLSGVGCRLGINLSLCRPICCLLICGLLRGQILGGLLILR